MPGVSMGRGCAVAESRLNQTALAYIDYLEMREGLGYDMHNTVYLFPKDLAGAHRKMVMEHNKSEADRRIREVNGQYPLIRKHYRSLRKKFYFEDEEFYDTPCQGCWGDRDGKGGSCITAWGATVTWKDITPGRASSCS